MCKVYKRYVKMLERLFLPTQELSRDNMYKGIAKQLRALYRVSDELSNAPKPWFTSGAMEWLENEIDRNMVVLEYGGGYSSLWWCKKAKLVYTVEANIEWITLLSLEFYNRPELLARWRLVCSPCDWYSSYEKPKRYWRNAGVSLSAHTAESMEKDYLHMPSGNIDVVVVDGSIRPQTIRAISTMLENNDVKIIVVDNTESESIVHLADTVIPKRYKRFDFPASSADKIPSWQNGRWMTTVWAI